MSLSRALPLSFALLIAVALSAATASAADKPNLDGWPQKHKDAANKMMDKYGNPDQSGPDMLVWMNKGPYTRIILMKKEFTHNFPVPHKDFLEHEVACKVPADKVGELGQFDGSVIVDRTRGTLGARCDSEAHNLIALNLANDIIKGKKTVQQAREAYAWLAMQGMKGNKQAYATNLQFQPPPIAEAGTADHPVKPNAAAMNEQGAPGQAQPAAAQQQPEQSGQNPTGQNPTGQNPQPQGQPNGQ